MTALPGIASTFSCSATEMGHLGESQLALHRSWTMARNAGWSGLGEGRLPLLSSGTQDAARRQQEQGELARQRGTTASCEFPDFAATSVQMREALDQNKSLWLLHRRHHTHTLRTDFLLQWAESSGKGNPLRTSPEPYPGPAFSGPAVFKTEATSATHTPSTVLPTTSLLL